MKVLVVEMKFLSTSTLASLNALRKRSIRRRLQRRKMQRHRARMGLTHVGKPPAAPSGTEEPATLAEIDAYYPAFDITPPHLVAGIITVHGVLSPYDLKRHYT